MSFLIHSLKDKIYKDNKLVYEFDFARDIDISKSDIFIVNHKDKYIEFIGTKNYNTVSSDYIDVIGEKETKSDYIRFTETAPMNFNTYGSDIDIRDRFIYAAINKSVDMKISDGLLIEFSEKLKTNFTISIVNRKYYEVLLEIYNRKIPLCSEVFAKEDTKRVKFDFYPGNCIKIHCLFQNVINMNYSTTIDFYDDLIFAMLNIKNGTIYINGQKRGFKIPEDFLEEDMFIQITHTNKKPGDGPEYLEFKPISYCSKEGFLYFKPFNVANGKSKVFVFYKGNPRIENYSYGNNSWQILKNDCMISEEKLTIRANMSTGDRIYGIIIASDK